ncbi:proton-associated sugar transporter A-like [Anopheles marshallii]|uniref:proton-associated sugar transporter A-like n=1 Tax=Anopheles marshallii TaxID=1521116 RepID=UPI00237B1E2A|nr:proton-associated sugar transporter A-like [Anopheles marshallii]
MYREIKGIYNWLASFAISGTRALSASRPIRALQCTRRYRTCSVSGVDATMVKTGSGGGSSAASGRVVLGRKSHIGIDPVVEELRRVREENARHQQYDYSHVFRKKSLLDFVRLSFVIMGIEIVYSAETAFVTPILLGIGIEHQLMTIVWGISPLIGFIVSPFLGTFSDRCRSRLGRRRPLLLVLGMGLVLGCLLLPFGETIGHWLGDIGESGEPVINNTVTIDRNFNPYQSSSASAATTDHYKWAIVVTILGTILLDFCADSSQAPSMAYLLDVSLPEDHGQACSTYSLLSGVGGCIGYLIGAIDWDGTVLGEFLGGNINTVFILVTVVFALCLGVTVSSFREIPLPLMERNELLQPLTERIIASERERFTTEKKLLPMKDIADTLLLQLDSEHEPPDEDVSFSSEDKKPLLNEFLEEEQQSSKQRSAKEFLKTTFRIPSTLGVLCVTNLFCWMSHISYSLYFTDFVGENVFGGDPMAHSDSDEYALYIEGVRYGCFGMAIYSIACSTYSCTIERMIRLFRARTVYSGGLLIDFVGMLCMAMFPNKVTVYVFSVTGGIVGALLFTMPYIILAKYHAKGLLDSCNETNPMQPRRGLASDISIIGSMLFVAQIILSLTMGPLVTLTGTTASVIYTASVCSLLASICATQVQYLDL